MNPIYSYSQLEDEIGLNAERLAYIDFKLLFTGIIRRSDMKLSFGLAEAAASKALTLYGQYRPDNFYYDRAEKVNVINLESFESLLPFDAEIGLGMLAHGFNKNKLLGKPILPYARVGRTSHSLDIENVSTITRAMYGGFAIESCYISAHSDKHNKRELVPLAIINDGINWIFRAYDRNITENQTIKSPKFKNFSFSRATNVHKIVGEEGLKRQYELLQEDSGWMTTLPLLLKLHPSLGEEQEKTVRYDFGLAADQKEVLLTERPALIWILTKIWNIDVGNESEKNKFYKFQLKNRDMVSDYL